MPNTKTGRKRSYRRRFIHRVLFGRHYAAFDSQFWSLFPMFVIFFGSGAEVTFLVKYSTSLLQTNQDRIAHYDLYWHYCGFVGIIVTAIVTRKYGRRNALTFAYAIFLSGLFILLASPTVYVSSIGYISWTLAVESLPMAVIMYITEIAEPDLRGFFYALTILSHQLGSIIGHLFPSYTKPNHKVIAAWCVWPILCILMSMAVPESPQWLANNRRRSTAKKQYFWLYEGKKKNSKTFNNLIKSVQEFKKTSAVSKIFTKSFLKPMMILLMIYAARNCLVIIEKMYDLIGDRAFAGDNVPAYHRKINNVVNGMGPTVVLLMICRVTRKWLFIIPSTFAYILILGIKLFGEKENTSAHLWHVVTYKALTSMGTKTLPASFAAEYFAPRIREFGCAVVLLQALYFDKLISWNSFSLANRLDLFWLWWCIGIVCISVIVFIMPVPDGVSLTTLEKRINGKWKQIFWEKDVIEEDESDSADEKEVAEEIIPEEELPRSPVDIEVLD